MRTSNIMYTLQNIETGEINESKILNDLCVHCDYSRPALGAILRGSYPHKSKFSKKYMITSRALPVLIEPKIKLDKYELTILETGEVRKYKSFKDMSDEVKEYISKLNDIIHNKIKSDKYAIKKI